MEKFFGTTAAIEETAISSRTRGFARATFSFLIIYFVGNLISSILLMIPMYFVISNHPDFTALVASGNADIAAIEEVYLKIMSEISWFNTASLFATVGIIGAAIYYAVKFDGRRMFSLGIMKKGAVGEYFAGLGIGLIMFAIVAGIIYVSGGATFVGLNNNVSVPMILLCFVGFLIQGMSEEILLRGYYFVTAASQGKVAVAVFASSIAFSLLHLGNSGVNWIGLVNIFLFGVFTALYFLRRGNIWGVAAIHSMWNFAQGNIFGFSVSGNGMGDSIFVSERSTGSALNLINGGDFGPEGGLAVTAILVIGITVLLFMKNKKIEVPQYKFKGEFFSA